PSIEAVKMGPLAGPDQVQEVQSQVDLLKSFQALVYGEDKKVLIGGSYDKGAFFSPLLFRNEKPLSHLEAHTIEAFGPVSTLMPYQNTQEAYKLVRLGEGSLVCSLVTMDMDFAQEFVMECGSLHGRILILNEECASESTGHGSPL